MKTVEIKTRVNEETRDAFKELCESKGITISEYLRRFIRDELQQKSKKSRTKISECMWYDGASTRERDAL